MRIIGTDDRDRLTGTLLADTIFGRSGDDIIFGLDGNDVLHGEAGNDFIDAGAGNDIVYGGGEDDTILGGAGDDRLYGEAGNDRMTGGEGDDTFIFTGLTGRDTITDFSVTNDSIQIRVSGVDDFDDLRFSQTSNGDAVVSWGSLAAESAVTLIGVSVAALSTDDFSFG